MQREIRNKVQLGENLNPLKDISKVPCINNIAALKNVFGKVDKLKTLWGEGKADISLMTYIPGLAQVSRQGRINKIVEKKPMSHLTALIKKRLNLQSSQRQTHIQTTQAY